MDHHPRTLIELIGNTCYTLQAQLKSSACQPNPSQSPHQHVVTLRTTCHLRNERRHKFAHSVQDQKRTTVSFSCDALAAVHCTANRQYLALGAIASAVRADVSTGRRRRVDQHRRYCRRRWRVLDHVVPGGVR